MKLGPPVLMDALGGLRLPGTAEAAHRGATSNA